MSKKSVILPGVFGNALEWYDFTTYAFFVPIISKVFFPMQVEFLSLLITLSIFSMSFLIRPLGGVLFGYIGDKFGRKKALIISIITMTIPTFLFGLLPTYNTIGLTAPLLVTFLRLIQGLSVGGELSTTISFLVEHAPENRRGFMGSLAICSAFLGIAASSLVSTLIMQSVDQEQLLLWGWRIPFLLAAILGIIGLHFRLNTKETHHYTVSHKTHESKTYFLLKHLFKKHYSSLLIAISLTSIMGAGNYFVIGYFVTFLSKTEGLPLKSVMASNLASICVFASLMPILGFLSDFVGRKRIIFIGITGTILSAYPVFWLLTQGSISYALAGQLLFILFLAAINAALPAALAELFPTHIRNSGIGIGYNISLALFGGTAPLIGLTLVRETADKMSPAIYLIFVGCISMAALFFFKESYRKKLS